MAGLLREDADVRLETTPESTGALRARAARRAGRRAGCAVPHERQHAGPCGYGTAHRFPAHDGRAWRTRAALRGPPVARGP